MKKWMLIVFLCACYACQSEAERTAVTSQEQALDSYITSAMKADSTIVLVIRNNSYRLIKHAGVEPVAEEGDLVEFTYVGYVFSNGKGAVFDTNKDTLGFSPTRNNGKGIIGQGNFIPGLDNGLIGVMLSEQSEILFTASEGYGNTTVGLVPSLSPLLFDVKITKITKQ